MNYYFRTPRPAFRWLGMAALLAGAYSSQGQTPPNVNIPPAAAVQSLAAAEYFLNTDPGFGNGTPLAIAAGSTASTTQAIPAAGLDAGVYRYYIRVKDQGGNWGLTTTSLFYVLQPGFSLHAHTPPGIITKAEYFFDTDPGFGNGQNILLTSDTVTTITNLAVDITNLSLGTHRLFVRARDQWGSWSISSAGTLNIIANIILPSYDVPAPVVSMEYFFDTDPGFGNAGSLAVTPGTDVSSSELTGVGSLPVGTHRYFVRAKDQKGNWSQSQDRTLFIINATIDLPPHPEPAPVSALEYFVDTDPGFGNGTIVTVPDTTDLNHYNLSVAIPGLADGLHSLWIRTIEPYSLSMVKTFYLGTPLPLDFIYFSVAKEKDQALVRWEIAENYSTGHFEVERSTDGKHFSSLGTVAWDNTSKKYEWHDDQLAGLDVPLVYYRIRSMEPGSAVRYTNVLSLRLTENVDPYAYIFPNPVKDVLKVHFDLRKKEALLVRLTDNDGNLLLQKLQSAGNTQQEMVIDLSGYATGIYNLSLTTGDWQKVLKVVKQ